MVLQKKKTKTPAAKTAKLQPLQKFSLFFFKRPRKTALLALVIVLFGVLSYTTLLKREGFPAINTPFALAQGTYFVNDAAKVDAEVAKPLSDFLLKQPGVDQVITQSFANYYGAQIAYKSDVNAESRSAEIQKSLDEQNILPEGATAQIEAFKFGFTERGDDAVVSFIDTKGTATTEELAKQAEEAVAFFKSKNLSLVKDVSIIDPFESATNPMTGEMQTTQKTFERFGERPNNQTNFYNSVIIGFTIQPGSDAISFDDQIRAAAAEYTAANQDEGYRAEVSASYALGIKQQISELQKVLLEALLAILVVGSLIIAIRASLITVLAMVSVILATLGLLFLIDYTLNTITLFALILALSLIVDDTIIMVEALDAQRRRKNDPDEIVATATKKVGRAMIAATSTAALSFAPLLFVGGILGGFIRAIPVTIIAALAISLLVALIFIPLFARYLLLGKKHVGKKAEKEPAASLEAKIARGIAAPMLWAQHSKKKLALVGTGALLISFVFIGAAGYLAGTGKVKFDIFPVTKDTNQITTTLTFPTGTDITEAQAISDEANQKIAKVINGNFVMSSNLGQANAQSAFTTIDLIDYNDRSTTAPQIIDDLKKEFIGFDGAAFTAASVGAGPPPSSFAANIDSSTDRVAALKLAEDMSAYLQATTIKRLDGTIVKFDSVSVSNTDVYTRSDSKPYVSVTAKFVDTDTTTLVGLTQTAIEKEFTAAKVASYGLSEDAISFDFGQEDENQDSFKTMLVAFPILLLVIYILLSLQFRSLLQPLLIFMAIPFSLFGITLGLYLTNNPMSFFAMLGFFALIGLSIKNTILLVDYANQSRRAGMNPVDAAHEALAERFRPLIATSLTAVVSLIPLAISSPFWEGLAVVLIFGLLSSTFLVITVFPYYYLGGEFLRGVFRRRISRPIKRAFKKA